MASTGRIKAIPLNPNYTAVLFQGYDEENEPIMECAETALTNNPESLESAFNMVLACMILKGLKHDDIEPPRCVEEYEDKETVENDERN